MSYQSTLPDTPLSWLDRGAGAVSHLALVILWSRHEPGRVGEILFVARRTERAAWLLGRDGRGGRHLTFFRQRPGEVEDTGPIRSPRISREQLELKSYADGTLGVKNIGKCALRHEGVELNEAVVKPGDLLELANELLLLCVEREASLPPLPDGVLLKSAPFGWADTLGIVGESPAAWRLRSQIAFAAIRGAHVLILGESGTGKELVARALHHLSARGHRTLVSRNAATFPEGLIDAELFGNAKGFPNPGMVERPGLVGEAEGSTLFLDEIGELPAGLQAHLLRLLDSGEYQRLGEAKVRRTDARIIAATNRAPDELKHDVAARFGIRVQVPSIAERREDIPLLIRHRLRTLAQADADLAQRFFRDGRPDTEPRVTPGLVAALVRHDYHTHVRELDTLLWQAMSGAESGYLDVREVMDLRPVSRPGEPVRATVDAKIIDKETLLAALERNQGVLERVWRDLGLPNRFVLYRLMDRHGVRRERGTGAGDGDAR